VKIGATLGLEIEVLNCYMVYRFITGLFIQYQINSLFMVLYWDIAVIQLFRIQNNSVYHLVGYWLFGDMIL